jgi:peptidoglycan/xylan/chitin deacetylase (PgdA/CDA1 family)
MLALLAVLIAGAALLSHTAPAPFIFEAFRPKRSLWRVEAPRGSPPAVYLTFDDGPNPDWTPVLLDALRDTDVRATFFLIDEHITTDTAPIVRRMVEEGHAIGLHSGSRAPMIMRPEDLAARLRAAAQRISMIAGREPCPLFRPHAGWRSATMYEALRAIDYRLAGWSWGMWDWDWWRRPTGSRVAARLAARASPGDIIVIHDGHHRNPRADRRHAADSVRMLAPALRARGFEFLPLCGVVQTDGGAGPARPLP